MSFFRSEEMRLCDMILYKETAFDCLVELGYEGMVEFRNVGMRAPIVNQIYARKVERCTNLQKIIFRFQDELNKMGLRTFYYTDVDEEYKPKVTDLREIEDVLIQLNEELADVTRRLMQLRKTWMPLLEHREVLLRTDDFLTGAKNTEAQITSCDSMLLEFLQNYTTTPDKENLTNKASPLRFITGTVPVATFAAFELMVWRVSRGNAYVKRYIFELPKEIVGTQAVNRYKYVFILTFVGDEMYIKMKKVCDGFGIKIYACPVLGTERCEKIKDIAIEIKDIEKVYMQILELKQRVLAAPLLDLYIWRSKIRKIQAVYQVLCRLRNVRGLRNAGNKYFEVECWIPKRYIFDVRKALLRGARRGIGENSLHTFFPPILNVRKDVGKDSPPTLFHTNKFTYAFQKMVDTYGIATYREINPAPFSIVTFPFFFAIMFSDMGHGLLLVLIAIGLIWNERKYAKIQRDRTETNEVFDLLFAGRYIMLLTGVFSIYTGFIFNNLFSKTLNIFGSSWRVNFTLSDVQESAQNDHFKLDPARLDNFLGNPYLFGMDPMWHFAAGIRVAINNSFKMKLSITLGVAHIIFGQIISAVNALHFEDKVELYFRVFPELIFMCAIYLYFVMLVFLKWFSYGGHKIREFSPGCAPSLFYTFLNMLLFKEPTLAPEGCADYIYSLQPIVQKLLILIAVICVIVLLCGLPIRSYLMQRRDPIVKNRYLAVSREFNNKAQKRLPGLQLEYVSSSDLLGKNNLSDIIINQAITTIEFILSSISHTASYLRLWALSLAHGEVSFLVWELVMNVALRSNRGELLNSILLFGAFAVFAVLTVIFLVVMEGLAAFMHTLRLHWFEFQSRFYKGNGHAFTPFYFEPSKRIDANT